MMTNAQLAAASLDDIVFDGRNQIYGAYVLRSLYQRHVTRALIIATALLALLLGFPLVAQWLKGKTPPAPPKVLVEVAPMAPPLDKTVVTPPIAPPVAPPARAPQQATRRFTTLVVTPDNKVTEEVPDQKQLATEIVGPKTTEGPATTDFHELEPVEGPTTIGDVVKPSVYTYVEQMPELPGGGGQAAIVAAILRAVKYPALALRNGVEGRLFASFTVNSNGEVTDVKIVKGLGSGLDEETLRAIKTLPKFIPGKQNGREVSVSFTVPITYRIQ